MDAVKVTELLEKLQLGGATDPSEGRHPATTQTGCN